MICTLVCRVHLMCYRRAINVTFTYIDSAYHHVGNVLDFKPGYCISHMLLFRLCFYCFSFNHNSSFLKCYTDSLRESILVEWKSSLRSSISLFFYAFW